MFRCFHKSLCLLLLCNYITGVPPNPFMKVLKAPIQCGYQFCPKPNRNSTLNIHIIPHTHFDLGWLKTVDQYFNVGGHGVYNTISSIIHALVNNTARKFVLSEASYISFWWETQTDAYKQILQTLINLGHIEIAGGGWSMNGEACTHYQSIIDQMTWGLRKLDDMFGECGRPKVGWQLDAFGHSAEMASILSQMRYDGLFLGRIDYQDKNKRFSTGTAEFVWSGNPSLDDETPIFTNILPNLYHPPFNLCIDSYCSMGPLNDKIIEAALTELESKRSGYATNNLIATMGGDNQYSDAGFNFDNIEKIISYVQNRNSSLSMFYSTPSCYVKSVVDDFAKINKTWPRKTGDFFPYATSHHAYWTGFFSSRPALKRLERIGNNYLQICKQLCIIAKLDIKYKVKLETLISELGILQHHDAITGTSTQAVAEDYVRRLTEGFKATDPITLHALNKLVNPEYTDVNEGTHQDFKSCLLSNLSMCDITERSKRFVVTIYNPLGRSVNHYVRLPVTGLGYVVTDPKGTNITVDVFPLIDRIRYAPGRNSSAQAEIIFLAERIPPLGFKSYFISRVINRSSLITPNYAKSEYKLNGIEIKLHNKTGKLVSIKMNNRKLNITHDFRCYDGIGIDNQGKTSGAYVFRPTGRATPVSPSAEFALYEGKIVVEFRQTFGNWSSVVIRLYKTENFVEFDWVIGPVNEDAYRIVGREIISRYATNLATNGEFYTDSNGRQMLKRIRNRRTDYQLHVNEPISGNYYPVTSKISIRDKIRDIELNILTDRAHGGSSVNDGNLELMLYRLLASDDGHGVEETLKEKAFGEFLVVRGSHYLILGPCNDKTGSSISTQRDVEKRKQLSPWIFVSRTKKTQFAYYNQSVRMQYSGLTRSLPQNIHLLTLQPWKNATVLIRLEHTYGKGEHKDYSKRAIINIKNLFTAFQIVSVDERTLGANQKVNVKSEINLGIKKNRTNSHRCNHTGVDKFHIVLCPMEIRTFIVSIKPT